MEDKVLIKHCIAGRSKHQKLLLEKYSKALYAVALRYCAAEADAKDVLQESWIMIFNSLLDNKYSEQGKLKAWLSRVVINNALRTNAKNKARVVKLESNYMPKGSSENSSILDSMTISEVLKLIDKLPFPSNQIFKMHVIDGYKHKEISTMLGIAESTSRVHLTNARIKMKSFFPNFQELINTR